MVLKCINAVYILTMNGNVSVANMSVIIWHVRTFVLDVTLKIDRQQKHLLSANQNICKKLKNIWYNLHLDETVKEVLTNESTLL